MEKAERLCRRIAIMDHGRIIAEGSPRALISEHIESQVVEVHGPGCETWMERAPRAPRASNGRSKPFLLRRRVEPVLADLRGRGSLRTCTGPRTSKTCSSS